MKFIMENWRSFINEDLATTDSKKGFMSPHRTIASSVADKTIKTTEDYKEILSLSKQHYNTTHLPQDPSPRSPEQQREFRDIIDYKRDAFRHILANTWFASQGGFSDFAMRMAGQAVEFAGAVSNFIKGRGFESDREMDLKNNELGLRLAKKILPGTDLPSVAAEVKNLIDNGKFYVEYKGEVMPFYRLSHQRPQAKPFRE